METGSIVTTFWLENKGSGRVIPYDAKEHRILVRNTRTVEVVISLL